MSEKSLLMIRSTISIRRLAIIRILEVVIGKVLVTGVAEDSSSNGWSFWGVRAFCICSSESSVPR